MSGKQNNSADKRPLSPHLMIYRLPMTALLSITHRITGFALYIGALLLGWWIVANVYGCGNCINALVYSTVGRIFLFLWSIALYYHLLNGIRHLFWDMGKGFDIRVARKTDVAVLLGTMALTAASWYVVVS